MSAGHRGPRPRSRLAKRAVVIGRRSHLRPPFHPGKARAPLARVSIGRNDRALRRRVPRPRGRDRSRGKAIRRLPSESFHPRALRPERHGPGELRGRDELGLRAAREPRELQDPELALRLPAARSGSGERISTEGPSSREDLRVTRAEGRGQGRFSGGLTLDGLEAVFRDARVRGAAALSGRCDLSFADKRATDGLEGELTLDRAALEGSVRGLPFRLDLAGRAGAKRAAAGPPVDGRSSGGGRDGLLGEAPRSKGPRSISSPKRIGGSRACHSSKSPSQGSSSPRPRAKPCPSPGSNSWARLISTSRARRHVRGKAIRASGPPSVVVTSRFGTGSVPGARIRMVGKGLGLPAYARSCQGVSSPPG